jgi:vancomycin resistance protein YoaR
VSDAFGSDESREPASGSRRRVLLICFLTAAGVLLVWAGAYAAAGSGVPRDTSVLGVDIGGLDRGEAVDKLEAELSEQAQAPLAVRVGQDSYEVVPADAGLTFDAGATVDRVDGRTWNPAGLWRSLTGAGKTTPVVNVDETRLSAAVSALAETADAESRDADVVFEDGEARIVEPQEGRAIDQDAARSALRSAYLKTSDAPIELEAAAVPPTIGADEAQRAFDSFAEPALSSPVTVRAGGESIRVPVDTLAAVLSMEPEGDKLTPRLDAKALREALDDELREIERSPRNATVRISGGEPEIVPARAGQVVRDQVLAAAVLEVLPREANRLARVEMSRKRAERTTAQVRALGIKEVVGEFTTQYPYAAYRVTNIGRAAEKIDGTLLEPGETFSLNGIVGERTRENGFAEGTIIRNGRFATELGGGVSQVATTVFNAMFFAGLKDVEHKPHSFYISRYPEGREATVAWPVLDLKFQNDTEYGVLVDTIHNEGSSLTVRLWSTKVWDIDSVRSGRSNIKSGTTRYDTSSTCVPQGGVPGFDVTVTRVFTKGGEEVKRERFFTRYNPADTIICGPEPGSEPRADDADEDERADGEGDTPRRRTRGGGGSSDSDTESD